MEFTEIASRDMPRLKPLHEAYKREIGEDAPTDADFERLAEAVDGGRIHFYGCVEDGALVGCCSITPAWSTFHYGPAGIFEDFYILPEYRHRGVARNLVQFAAARSGVASLTVGCADCDVEMYKALGFRARLGNLLAYDI